MSSSLKKSALTVKHFLIFSMILITLTGCSPMEVLRVVSSQEGKFFVDIELIASNELNPNHSGLSFPVEVQVFLMTNDREFKRADYFEFHQSNTRSKTDLEKSVVLRPGEVMPVRFEINEVIRYVGIVAAFQDIDRAVWRDVVQIGDNRGFLAKYLSFNNRVQLRVHLDGTEVYFEK
ncbi:type VI secretion system lipoprotein TssJ [Nitrincola tibetensis]|uniref:Type VI secretion system lipoprotein TssJ n=1 Tax=Nitrincola tibetensis TaxID=2219697 RepID=A0A364NPM3_9GAMM|nr:type VI secretion system lipoprotein TssJ [Nitrincola tibetensis]RAU19033.1 type VI secretion system lipoprotein TssJ [Nitrincola tibetensis]